MEETGHLGGRGAERSAAKCSQYQAVMFFEGADAQDRAYLFLQDGLIGFRDITANKLVVTVLGVVV